MISKVCGAFFKTLFSLSAVPLATASISVRIDFMASINRSNSCNKNILAVGKVLPNLNGKLDGIALRVPVNCGSIVDLVCNVEHATSVEDVHDAIESSIKANNLQEIISFCEEPIVSNDIVGRKESVIIDKSLTSVNEKMIKLLLWYDNETAYSQRLLDLIEKVSESSDVIKES